MKKICVSVIVFTVLIACNNEKKDEKKSSTEMTEAATATKPPAELLDMSVAQPVMKSMQAFVNADVDGMVANFDDHIRYAWSSGDSLIGKQAVADYYRGRWKLLDSVALSNTILLPVQVNESQTPAVSTGKWVLFWGQMNVKYKNGKKLQFWVHNVNHLNDAGKVDFLSQYLDRAPIMEATKGMK